MPAEIILFPARNASPPAAAAPPAPPSAEASQDRLRRALAHLNAASANQRQAVGAWRQALSDLQASMRALDKRLGSYRDQLDQLQHDVTGLHGQAERLERWAGNAERQARNTPTG